MNLLKKPLTALCAVAVVITLLLTVVANVVFGDINYYQREFEKYNVTENIDMSYGRYNVRNEGAYGLSA